MVLFQNMICVVLLLSYLSSPGHTTTLLYDLLISLSLSLSCRTELLRVCNL